MERVLSDLRAWLRDVAFRAGLPRFWRWWTTELAPLVPAAPRSAIQRRRTRPILDFGEGEVVVWRPDISDGAFRLAKVATIPLTGDAAATAAAGRAAVAALAALGQGGARGAPRVVVALPPRQVLRKELVLPAAVEQDLRQTLAYDLDRHTPFRPDQVYFDAVVAGRDPAKKTIRVDWTAALKTVVDGARRHAEAWGASVIAVLPGPVAASLPSLNLLPEEARPPRMLWRRWQIWAPLALVCLVGLAVVLIPLVQKREYVIALQRQTEDARVQAEAASAIRREFERLEAEFNYPLSRKYAYPGTVQILDDVTRLLPDDTWITQLEMKTTTKGRDSQRELFLRGESANGGKLIGLLEDSKLVQQAALRSSTTKLQPGPGEVFDLGAQLKPTAPPAIATAPATGANADAPLASAPGPGASAAPSAATPAPSAPPPATAAPAPGPAATSPTPTAAPAATTTAVPSPGPVVPSASTPRAGNPPAAPTQPPPAAPTQPPPAPGRTILSP